MSRLSATEFLRRKFMSKLSIVGGGFAGVWGAMSAAAERIRLGASAKDIQINLISNDPHLVIRPRLYEGANPEMRTPLKPLLDVIGVEFELARVREIIPSAGHIILEAAGLVDPRDYDSLILASGSHMPGLPVPGIKEHGFSIDTFAETARFDRHLENLMQQYAEGGGEFTIVVVGASFTGIELVTELRQRLGESVNLVLLDRSSVVGGELGENLTPLIDGALSDCNVEIMLEADIVALDTHGLVLVDGRVLQSKAVVFATGLQASPLTKGFNAPRDASGRLEVNEFLKLPDEDAVFVAGDVARAMADDNHATFMSCQHAMVLGRYAGHNAVRQLTGQALLPYRQETYATCLDLGPAGAVFTMGWDREVQKTGADGKDRKQQINRQWIYPPDPAAGADAIFQSISLAPEAEAA